MKNRCWKMIVFEMECEERNRKRVFSWYESAGATKIDDSKKGQCQITCWIKIFPRHTCWTWFTVLPNFFLLNTCWMATYQLLYLLKYSNLLYLLKRSHLLRKNRIEWNFERQYNQTISIQTWNWKKFLWIAL